MTKSQEKRNKEHEFEGLVTDQLNSWGEGGMTEYMYIQPLLEATRNGRGAATGEGSTELTIKQSCKKDSR